MLLYCKDTAYYTRSRGRSHIPTRPLGPSKGNGQGDKCLDHCHVPTVCFNILLGFISNSHSKISDENPAHFSLLTSQPGESYLHTHIYRCACVCIMEYITQNMHKFFRTSAEPPNSLESSISTQGILN